jgi:hypothetical protein
MKKLWAPWVVAVVTVVVIVVVLIGVTATIAEAGLVLHPGAFGEKIGRAMPPLALVGGVVAYFVQKSRRS